MAKDEARKAARASRPGAVSVPADEAARLDQRIAEKRERSISGKVSAATSATRKSTQEGLSNLEADVAAKVRAKGRPASKPGAQAMPADADRAVSSKVRRETSTASRPGAVPSLVEGEDAVASKVRRETSTSTTPGARAELNNLEDSVASKVRRETSQGGRAALTSLEDKASAKIRRDTTSSSVGARGNLANLEDSIAQKMTGAGAAPGVSIGARSELANLEASVSMKGRTGASARDDLKNSGAVTTTGKTGNSSAREQLTGIENQVVAKNGSTKAGKRGGSDTGGKTSELKEQAPGQLRKDAEGKLLTGENGGNPSGSPPDLEFGHFDGAGGRGLAVAVAVEEEEDDMFIPSAVEYDPDAKPPMYRNRRFRLYAFLALVIIVVIAVGVAVGATMGTKKDDGVVADPTPAPTSAPTAFREGFGIRAQIESMVGSEKLEDPESPYAKALEWITFDDPMQITPEATNFIQRYTAAYFYYATTTDGPWLSCNPPEDPWSGETACSYRKLVSVYPNTYQDYPWTAWLSNTTECEWAGVFCDDQMQIRTLDLGT